MNREESDRALAQHLWERLRHEVESVVDSADEDTSPIAAALVKVSERIGRTVEEVRWWLFPPPPDSAEAAFNLFGPIVVLISTEELEQYWRSCKEFSSRLKESISKRSREASAMPHQRLQLDHCDVHLACVGRSSALRMLARPELNLQDDRCEAQALLRAIEEARLVFREPPDYETERDELRSARPLAREGSLVFPNERPFTSDAKQEGIFQLLGAIERQAPNVIRSLRDDVLPAYSIEPESAPESLLKVWRRHPAIFSKYLVGLPTSGEQAFKDRLGEWKSEFKLNRWSTPDLDRMFEDRIELLLVGWRVSEMMPDDQLLYCNGFYRHSAEARKTATWTSFHERYWAQPEHGEDPLVSPLTTARLLAAEIGLNDMFLAPPLSPAFDPTIETSQAYLDRIANLHRTHADEVAEAYKRMGATKPTKKRHTDHFDWLVKYHILSASAAAIADEWSENHPEGKARDNSNLQKSIRETARQIGLKLDATPGRPRKRRRRGAKAIS